MTRPKIKIERDWPLWAMKGPGWALPILVEWPDGNDMATVRLHPIVNYLDIQRQAAQARFKEKCTYFENGHWWIIGNHLPQLGCPIHTSNPEEVVEWTSPYSQTINNELNQDQHDFIDSFCQLGFVSDPKRTLWLWSALCAHMTDWLLRKNRVLDLGTFRLAAVPFRGDWKNIFIAKWIIRCNKDIRAMIRSIRKGGFYMEKELENPRYLACAGDPIYCLRHVEVMHRKSWWQQVARIEGQRAQAQDYWLGIQSMMKNHFAYAKGSLMAHLRQIVSKVPFTHAKDAARRPGIPEKWAFAKNRFVQVSLGDQVCAITVCDPEMAALGEPFDVAGEEEIMQQVQPV